MAEWAGILNCGAGTFVLKRAYVDTAVIDKATRLYDQIISPLPAAMTRSGIPCKSCAKLPQTSSLTIFPIRQLMPLVKLG